MHADTPNLQGLKEEEAGNVAKASGFKLRVIKRDGVSVAIAKPVSRKWLDVEVQNGIIFCYIAKK